MAVVVASLAIVVGVFADYACGSSRWRPSAAVTIYAHRGRGFGHPDNSVDAVRAAASAGFPSEIDVVLSSAGTPHVVHDAKLGEGDVRDSTDAELALNGILTLAAFLPQLSATRPVMIHVKGYNYRAPMTYTRAVKATTAVQAAAGRDGAGDSLFVSARRLRIERAADFQVLPVLFNVETTSDARFVDREWLRKQDGYALSTTRAWTKSGLVSYVTGASRNLDVYVPDAGQPANPHVYGLPATSIEADFPQKAGRTRSVPSILEAVFVRGAAGVCIGLAAGVAVCRLVTASPPRRERGRRGYHSVSQV